MKGNNGKGVTSFADLSPEAFDELVDLGRRLYDRSLVRQDQEHLTDPRGKAIGWLLDTRIPMLESSTFREVGAVLAERLVARGIRQVAGHGFGSYAITCSVLSAPAEPAFRAGFIRDERKPHGRRRLVEGPVDRLEPIAILDDIINSGRSALKALRMLEAEGFNVAGVLTLFNFSWSGGRPLLEEHGVWVDSLLDLNLRDRGDSGSDSPF